MKPRYLITVPIKMLFYGWMASREVDKCLKYKDFPHLVSYHRNLSHYYFKKAFGHLPERKEES